MRLQLGDDTSVVKVTPARTRIPRDSDLICDWAVRGLISDTLPIINCLDCLDWGRWARRVNVSHPADQSKEINGEMMINWGRRVFSSCEGPRGNFSGWLGFPDLGWSSSFNPAPVFRPLKIFSLNKKNVKNGIKIWMSFSFQLSFDPAF